MKKNICLFLMTIVLCVGFGSCNNEDNISNNSSSGSNVLVGKWNFQDTDSNGIYNASYTFNSDGTMLINDRNDLLNGQSVSYSYNDDTKKLTAFGIVLQLVWMSSSKFTIKYDNVTTIVYTKQ